VAEAERKSAVDALMDLARRLPRGACAGLITNQTYARRTDRRASIEMIILGSTEGAQS
jgi:CRISPR/Cas system-associated protein Csm6